MFCSWQFCSCGWNWSYILDRSLLFRENMCTKSLSEILVSLILAPFLKWGLDLKITFFRTFTRVPQLEYIGEANEEINNVRSIEECRNLCLEASVYQCRSATYDSNARVCRLTEETRRSAPSDFRIAERGVDYIENECADSKSKIHVSWWRYVM